MQLQKQKYQFIHIDRNDETVKAAAREIFHALGRNFENVRLDRNYYIEVLWDNIEPGIYDTYMDDCVCFKIITIVKLCNFMPI